MDKLKGADEVAADTYKMVLLKDWDAIRENVKKGLKRLGHDIIIVPMDDTPDGKKRKVDEMGCLWERTCGHCKNLFEAVTVGVCEVTDHRVEKAGDDEFAESCPHYENKWGYADERESSGEFKQLDEAIGRAFDEFRKEFGEDAKLENGDEFVTVLNNAVLIISLENGTLKTNFIGGAPFKVDMTLDIFEGSDEE